MATYETKRTGTTLTLEIVAALCLALGCISVLDMFVKLGQRMVSINLLAVFLAVGIVLWIKVRGKPGKPAMNRWQRSSLACGLLAMLLTCIYVPLVKFVMVETSFVDRSIVAVEYLGYFLPWEHAAPSFNPDGSRNLYEYAFGILELEWFAVIAVTLISYLLLQSKSTKTVSQETPAMAAI